MLKQVWYERWRLRTGGLFLGVVPRNPFSPAPGCETDPLLASYTEWSLETVGRRQVGYATKNRNDHGLITQIRML